jgi:exopolysaccharide biosynthesis polyprenyl glycosylphosphotransferase
LQVSQRRSLLVIADILLVNLAAFLALWLGAQRSHWPFSLDFVATRFYWFLVPTLGYVILATVNDCYDLKIASDPTTIAWALVRVTVQMLLAYLVVYFVSPRASLPRHIIGFFSLLLPVSLLLWRWAYIAVFSHPGLRRRVLIVGAGWAGRVIAEAIRENLSSQYELMGFVDDDEAKQGHEIGGLPVLGSTEDLCELTQRLGVFEVVVAISRNIRGHLFQNILGCHELGVQITPMSLLFEEVLGRVPVEHVGDNWFLVLPLNNSESFSLTMLVKRSIDIVVSLVGMTLFCVLLPFLVIAIKLDSPGPVFYRQTRVGKAGRVFELLKLRSMIPDAEGDGKPVWADANDSRITRVGTVLRKTRLDEMPQFYNVLKGDMSLIGPRPERPEFVAELAERIPFYRARLAVRPGLTGWAQTRFSYSSSVEDSIVKLQYDLYYIKHQSLYLDLLIFLRTFGVVVALKGR